jgi:hypothetical protein
LFGDEIKEGELNSAYGMHGRYQMHRKCLLKTKVGREESRGTIMMDRTVMKRVWVEANSWAQERPRERSYEQEHETRVPQQRKY